MSDLTTESQLEILAERYELLDTLGRGGQGTTYRARDRSTNQFVAVKELDLEAADDWKAIELFERESKVLESLDHPQIPDYVDAFHLSDPTSGAERFFLVQEFVQGDGLEELITRGFRFDEAGIIDFLEQLLHILVYLHDLSPRVVHRDIKPSNIIRRPDGSYTLIDFGAVQSLMPGASAGSTTIGTTGYMPLEQVRSEAVAASDLYALAATAVHLASHRHPTDLPMERMKIRFADYVNLSPELVAFLDDLLEPYVEDRLSSAREARHRLRNLHRPLAESEEAVLPRESALSQVSSRETTASGAVIQKSPAGVVVTLPRPPIYRFLLTLAFTIGPTLALLIILARAPTPIMAGFTFLVAAFCTASAFRVFNEVFKTETIRITQRDLIYQKSTPSRKQAAQTRIPLKFLTRLEVEYFKSNAQLALDADLKANPRRPSHHSRARNRHGRHRNNPYGGTIGSNVLTIARGSEVLRLGDHIPKKDLLIIAQALQEARQRGLQLSGESR